MACNVTPSTPGAPRFSRTRHHAAVQHVAPVDPVRTGRRTGTSAPAWPCDPASTAAGRPASGRSASGTKPSAFQSVMERRSLKRLLPSAARNVREVRPLRSTGVTPLRRYYEPVRLPAEAAAWLCIPTAVAAHRTPHPRRVSQVPRLLCRRALSPLTPDGPTRARARCFRIGGRLQHLRKIGHRHWVHEAESGSLALGLTSSLSSLGSDLPRGRPRPPDRSASRVWLPPRRTAATC